MKLSRLHACLKNRCTEFSDLFGPGAPEPPDPRPETDPDIRELQYRSDQVQPGDAFIAVPGFRVDGHQYVDDAIRRGASLIIVQADRLPAEASDLAYAQSDFGSAKTTDFSDPVTWRLPDTRRAMGWIAAALYDFPADSLHIVAITGTNGKTSISLILESILTAAGYRPGVMGTIDIHFPGRIIPAPVTTPEAPDMQRIMAQMRDSRVTHLIMEASSQALDLHRLNGCEADTAIFTNLSRDHLDWHHSMDRYWASKKRLFTEFLREKKGGQMTAGIVVNADSPYGRELAEIFSGKCITAGQSENHLVYSEVAEFRASGIRAQIETPAGPVEVNSPLIGRHNLENIRLAAGAAVQMGIPVAAIEAGIRSCPPARGRLERVMPPATMKKSGGANTAWGGPYVYVDYSHTPDALAHALATLRELLDLETGTRPGKLICVFGCGGDRDPGKRPEMGNVAGTAADLSIITSDNPRSEDPLQIIEDILPGLRGAEPGHSEATARRESMSVRENENDRLNPDCRPKSDFRVIPDRGEAIRAAILDAGPTDMILIAGKGHETYQIIGDQVLDFDDLVEAGRVLAERMKGEGTSR